MEELLLENQKLKEKCDLQEQEISLLREQLRLLTAKMYGRSSERFNLDPDQLSLFPEDVEATAPTKDDEEEITYRRKKPGRKGIDPSVPRQDVRIPVPEDQRVCACGTEKVRIGEETSEQLEHTPAQVLVKRYIREKLACPHCEGVEDDGPTVVIAPPPPALIPRSIVTPSLLGHILTAKFVDGLPFYRQEKQLHRLGVNIARGSMANWTIRIAERCEDMVIMLMVELKKRAAVQVDETWIQVMNEEGRKNTTKSFMWLMRAGPPKIGPPDQRIPFPEQPEIIIYQYHPTRSSDVVQTILDDYTGYVQTDEYRGYDFLDHEAFQLRGLVHVLCLAHARRKFAEAATVGYGNKRSKRPNVAQETLAMIKKIYKVHRRIQEQALDADDFVCQRRVIVLPMLEALHGHVCALDGQVTPQSKLGKAISYSVRVLPKIMKGVECPNLTLDNNLLENKVRPIAMGRKNWLFCNTPVGAHALAIWFTLIETSMANGWSPDRYLMHLLNGLLHEAPLESLLPTNPIPTIEA